jgi:site-specific DNA recombinase
LIWSSAFRLAAMSSMPGCLASQAAVFSVSVVIVQSYGALMGRYETAQKGIIKINDKMVERTAKQEKITRFLDNMKRHDKLVTEFDEKLWLATVDSLTVHSESEMAVTFKDGSEVTLEI